MSAQGEMRRCLERGDVEAFRAINAKAFPHLSQPASREHAEIAMHYARTQAEFLSLRRRAWSHCWLAERCLPSGLPDPLRPRAERLYPRVVGVVGVSVNMASPILRPAGQQIQRAMCDAVEHAYADGRTEPEFVKARMAEAKASAVKTLFGALAVPRA